MEIIDENYQYNDEKRKDDQSFVRDINNWNMYCHLSALAMYTGIILVNIAGPWVIWIIKKNEYASVDKHGKASMNFQISMMIYKIMCIPFMFILVGFPMLFALVVINLVCVILASVKASNGGFFKYPISIKFIT